MPALSSNATLNNSYADLSEGPQISTIRLRQLLRIVQDNRETALWPLVLVNVVTCLEWFARTVLKHLIDYSADRVNPDAHILKELKLNYAIILRAHTQNFSIGDIVAISKNFSSFDDIDTTLNDLMKEASPSLLARIRKPWATLVAEALERRFKSKKAIAEELNTMFRKRHELVHGTPRHLMYKDQLDLLISRKELMKFIHYSLQYIKQTDLALRKFIPELSARSTRDNNINQRNRLWNSNLAIEKLEQAIERRIADDSNHFNEFREAQQAWRIWRKHESRFQTAEWGRGTARGAILMGYETSFNMDRLRSLEAYLRQLDRRER